MSSAAASPEPLAPRDYARRFATHAICGLYAGFFIFAVEAGDRIRVLRPSLWSAGEAARLAILMAATILAVGLLGCLAGAAWAAVDWVHERVAPRLAARAPERWRPLAGIVATAAVVAVVARLVSFALPWLVESRFYRIVKRVDTRLRPLGPLAAHPKIVFALLLSAAALALVAAHVWVFSRRGPRARIAAAVAGAAGLGLAALGFAADSRIEFTRYEFIFHVPLEVLYAAMAIAALLAAARAAGVPEAVATTRAAVLGAVAVGALGAFSILFGAVAMDANQNVKALFWNRSIVARRVFQFARFAADRDGDGYAAAFGNGDLDDSDPRVHPMAVEVAGNGVDDNCVGGDLASSDQPVGSLFAPVGLDTTAPAPPEHANGRNVILISVDCLRADHLSCYGYAKRTSPNVDRFAAESMLFENTYSQGTNTGHSFTSLFRSSYADDIFDDRVPTFARLLSQQGYRTTLINAVRTDVWLNAARWDKYKEMTAGFSDVHQAGEKLWNAATLTDEAIRYLDAIPKGQPHFTWVHYFDCHRPRQRHPEHDFGRNPMGVFDSNVAFVDEHMGRLLDHLRSTGALDDSLVFIVADHGEAFLEHGAQDHSNKPYLNNALVPLIVHAPGAAPGRFAEPCGLIDVAPTALAFAGLRAPAFYRGVDLLAATAAGALPHRQIVSETPRNLIESPFFSWALVEWPYKIVYDTRSNTTEVFDLTSDPGELHNLADQQPDLAARMRGLIGAWLDRESARTAGAGPGDEGLSDDAD